MGVSESMKMENIETLTIKVFFMCMYANISNKHKNDFMIVLQSVQHTVTMDIMKVGVQLKF